MHKMILHSLYFYKMASLEFSRLQSWSRQDVSILKFESLGLGLELY